MTKSRYISEKYIDMKNVCEEKEKEELLTKYDEINKMGIPFMIDSLVTSRIIWYFIVCNYNIFYIK